MEAPREIPQWMVLMAQNATSLNWTTTPKGKSVWTVMPSNSVSKIPIIVLNLQPKDCNLVIAVQVTQQVLLTTMDLLVQLFAKDTVA